MFGTLLKFGMSFLGGWRLYALVAAVGGAALLGLGWYISSLKEDRAEALLEVSEQARLVDHWKSQAIEYARGQRAILEAFEQYKAQAARNEELLAQERDSARRAAERAASIRAEIYNAPDSDTGPAAPVLDRVLDRMQRSADQGNGGSGTASPD